MTNTLEQIAQGWIAYTGNGEPPFKKEVNGPPFQLGRMHDGELCTTAVITESLPDEIDWSNVAAYRVWVPRVPSPPVSGEVKPDSFELPADHPLVIAMSQPLSERTKAELKAIDDNIRAAHAAGDFRLGGCVMPKHAPAAWRIENYPGGEWCYFDSLKVAHKHTRDHDKLEPLYASPLTNEPGVATREEWEAAQEALASLEAAGVGNLAGWNTGELAATVRKVLNRLPAAIGEQK